MFINSVAVNSPWQLRELIPSAGTTTTGSEASSSSDIPAATVSISDQAKDLLNTSTQQVSTESPDQAWERIKDNEITRRINAERKKLYDFLPEGVTYIQPQLKPLYFNGAFEYNSKIAKDEAQKVVDNASKAGTELNFNVVFQEFKNFNDIMPETDYNTCLNRLSSRQVDITVETPPENMTYGPTGTPDYNLALFTKEEKATFEKMHDYAVSTGLPTEQVDELVSYYGGSKSIREYLDLPPQSLKEYMTQLVGMVKTGYEAKRFNASVLDALLNNFDKFDQTAKNDTANK